MHTPRTTRITTLAAFAACLLFSQAPFAAPAATGIFVNGVELNPQQIAMLYQTTGVILPPGHYLVQGGCVSHLESGQTQCAPQPGQNAGGAYGYSGNGYGSDGYADYGGADGSGGGTYSYGAGAGGGYGYSNGDGTWFNRGSDYSGGYSVGGDSNGCVYTPDWSNC